MTDKDEEWMRAALGRPERNAELLAKNEELKLYPLAGWSTATLPENYLMVGIEFLTPPPEMSARILRLAMTRTQCSELAKVLERLAGLPHVTPPKKPS